MIEFLLGVFLILACWIGTAELCRRTLAWPREHPEATYGAAFPLVFMVFFFIGNSLPEEEGQAIEQAFIDPLATSPPGPAYAPVADLADVDPGPATALPATLDLPPEGEADPDPAPAPAKGFFAALAAGFAKLEEIENMGDPAASEAVERELDPAIADMNCGELQLLLDKVGDEALIARRAYWTARRKWEKEKEQALGYAETDDAAWARIENMEAALPELNRQWDYKFAKAHRVAAAMSDKGCCDFGESLSILNECHFAPGPHYANKPLVLSAERRARQEKERREQEREAAIIQAQGLAVAGMSCAEVRQYQRQAKATNDSLVKAKLDAEQAHYDAKGQAEKEGVTDEAAWGHIARLAAYAKEQEARFENHYKEYEIIARAVYCKEAACDLQGGGGRNAMAEAKCKPFPMIYRAGAGETLDTWSGEVYQQ